MKANQGITKNEFLQGVEFTHAKYYTHIALCYEKANFCDYGLLLLYNRVQEEYTDTYIIANINESSFDVSIIVLGEKIFKTVLFADCFEIIENYPLTTNQQPNENI